MSRFAGTKQRASERGTVLLMATATILIVVGMLALAVDVGYLMSGRGQLQNLVDASALAGAQGLRTAIEPPRSITQQTANVRSLARDYARFNPLRLAEGVGDINLADSDIVIEPASLTAPPRVIIKHRTALPMIFGNVFGLSSMNVSTAAIASTTVVDGGTGFVSGCWRPILIPDTFYDKDGRVWAISEPGTFSGNIPAPSRTSVTPDPNDTRQGVDPKLALQPGDRYISRFATTGANHPRNISAFGFSQELILQNGTVSISPTYGEATSVRDTQNLRELKSNGGRNLMGQSMILGPGHWRIIDFAASGITGDFPTDPVQQIQRGVCAPIQVGRLIQVIPPAVDTSGRYELFRQQLASYFSSILALSGVETTAAEQFRFAQTQNYPTPNANPRVIPVLLCSPVQYSDSPNNIGQYYITNIGAFYLEQVSADGRITGRFVREVMTSGIPLEPQNQVPNPSLLPVSVRLVR